MKGKNVRNEMHKLPHTSLLPGQLVSSQSRVNIAFTYSLRIKRYHMRREQPKRIGGHFISH